MTVTVSPTPTIKAQPVIPVMKPWLDETEAAAAADAVLSGWVAQGPRVKAFEAEFALSVGASHGIAVSSCTTALHLGLYAHGIGRGDDVLVPSLSFIATTNAARYVGANPVFADVDPITANVTVETLEAALTPATRAVIVVHQGGVPADVDAIAAFCRDRDVVMIEDAACSAGSRYKGNPVGFRSPLASWSFHPRKLLTTGEGGMVSVEDGDLAARLRRLREHGMSVSAADRHAAVGPVREGYLEVGFNFRMTDIQAAVGLVQLGKLSAMVQRRRSIVAAYQARLADVGVIRTVVDPPWGQSNFQSFWIEISRDSPATRDEVLAALAADGISARHGIMAAHRQPAYAGHPTGSLPGTDLITDHTLILPVFHQMTEDEQSRVVESLRRAVGAGAE